MASLRRFLKQNDPQKESPSSAPQAVQKPSKELNSVLERLKEMFPNTSDQKLTLFGMQFSSDQELQEAVLKLVNEGSTIDQFLTEWNIVNSRHSKVKKAKQENNKINKEKQEKREEIKQPRNKKGYQQNRQNMSQIKQGEAEHRSRYKKVVKPVQKEEEAIEEQKNQQEVSEPIVQIQVEKVTQVQESISQPQLSERYSVIDEKQAEQFARQNFEEFDRQFDEQSVQAKPDVEDKEVQTNFEFGIPCMIVPINPSDPAWSAFALQFK